MSLSLHRGPFNASPSDRRTCKQALCQSTYLKKDLPQRHFSQTVFVCFFCFFNSFSQIGNFIIEIPTVCWCVWKKTITMRGCWYAVPAPWWCVCQTVDQIRGAPGSPSHTRRKICWSVSHMGLLGPLSSTSDGYIEGLTGQTRVY